MSNFLRESLKNLKTVGTITRSSKFLCEHVVRLANLKKARCVVELGAGDGVLTRYILSDLPPGSKLLAFEINKNFCSSLREIHDKRLIIIEDSAERLSYYLALYGFAKVDVIISALPFVVFPDAVSGSIVQSCYDYLEPLGKYVQIQYSLLTKKLYKNVFGNLNIRFELLNLPPAFVFISQKRA